MEWLLILGLMAAGFLLFERLVRAEQKITELQNRQGDLEGRVAAALSQGLRTEDSDAVTAEEEAVAEPKSVEEPQPAVTLRAADEVAASEPRTEPAEEVDPEPVFVSDPPKFRPSFDFEELFGRRLPIWAGGITLAIAGVFLVRYSIEAGLLTPAVRVALAFLFGIGLLGGAEAAYRFRERVGDDRVRQALSGAGLATLYAGFYLAGTQYGLIGQTLAFLGLAAVTALAIALSYRFGLPSAILGLIGGFLAPVLVGGEDANLPMLALYLALVTGGLTYTGNRQGHPLLGLVALAAGLIWGFMLLAVGGLDTAEIMAIGIYGLVLGAILPALLASRAYENPARLVSAAVASIQLAILVDSAGYEPLAWGLYLLLGSALAFFAWSRPEMRVANVMAGIIGVILLALWPDFQTVEFGLVAAAVAALFAGVPLIHLARDRKSPIEPAMAAGIALAIGIVTLAQFASFETDAVRWGEALACLALALFPFASARMLWSEKRPYETVGALASVALLAFFAALCLLPDWASPLSASAIAAALIVAMRNRLDDSSSYGLLALIAAIGTIIALVASDGGFTEIERLFTGENIPSYRSALRWTAGLAPFALLAWFDKQEATRRGMEFIAALLAFAALAQLLPPIALVWIAALAIIALRWRIAGREAAMVALTLCILGWAAEPVIFWFAGGTEALFGRPMMLSDTPDMRRTFGFILPLALALSALNLPMHLRGEWGAPVWLVSLPIWLVIGHTLFKQLFAIDSIADFTMLGLAERTLWQALLLGAAWLFASGIAKLRASRVTALALAGASLLHLFWFGLLLHNPLFDEQVVGPAPLANLALLTGAVGIAALLSLRRWLPDWRVVFDGVIMALATLTAITLLRQVFAGSILPPAPMTEAEDLLRSLVGIVMAIAFLLIGSRRGERSWRVGSLVLMLATVIKVFAFDTAGLEGLIRIASFVALGASLIGIGWFYSRQLKAEPAV